MLKRHCFIIVKENAMDTKGNPEIITGKVLNGNPSVEDLKKFAEGLNL